MSHNPSRAERSESTQHKKPERSASFNQQRQFSGSVSSKGGGGTSSAPLNFSNRGVKKYNGNAPGVQSRPRSPNVNTGFSNSNSSQAVQNDAHKQQPTNRVSDAPVTSSASNVYSMDATPQKINQVVPRLPSSDISVASPSSNPSTASSEPKAPTIPAKPPGDASRSFPLQFGSISPGFMNGVQIPARTSSAPPNLDEQKKDQVRHQSLRTAVPAKPLSSIPKQLSTKKDSETFDQSNVGESQPVSISRRDTPVSAAPPMSQTQMPSVLSVPGMPMQLPFHQPQVTVQFGGPNPHIQSQSMSVASLQLPMQMPMPMPMPLPLGNPPMQQSMFVSGLPPHPMQSQGMMHQGQALNFPSQMGPQLPPQLGNMGMNMVPQFPQQQAVKYSGSRKAVKITHPETHEELRLDGSPGLRSHSNVQPQSQHIPSFPPNHLMNFYNATSFYFPPASSVPPNSTQVPPTSQPPKFYNQVTIKPAIDPHGEKDVLKPTSSILVGKAQSLNPSKTVPFKLHVDDLPRPQKEIGPSASSVLPESKPGPGTLLTSEFPSSSVDVEVNVLATSAVTFAAADGFASKSTTLTEEASNGVVVPYPIENEHKKSDNIGQKDQVSWQSTSHSNYPLQLSETQAVEAISASSRTNIVSEPVKELFSTTVGASSEASNLSSEGAVERKTSDTLKSLGTPYIKSGQLKPDSVGGNEDAEDIMLNTDQNSLDTLMEHLSLESSEICKVEESSLPEVASTADGLLERAKQKTKDPSGCCYDDTKVDDNVFESTHTAYCEGVENSSSVNGLSAQYINIIISDMPLSIPENISTGPSTVDQESSTISVASLEGALTYENEDNDPNSYGIISPSPAVTNEKILSDTNVQKTVVPRGKKKKKEFYKQAEAAGTSSDMYMAYKGPEEKKETAMLTEDLENISCSSIKQTSVDVPNQNVSLTEKPAQSRVEPDDWENAAEIPTPLLETSNNEIQSYDRDGDGDGLMIKRYSRDFLFKFAEQCTDLPKGFNITPDVTDAFMVSNSHFSREPHPSPGRNIDRPIGGSRLDRRGSELGDEDKWIKFPVPLVSGRGDTRVDVCYVGNVAGFRNSQGSNYGVLRNPRGQTPVHNSGGILSGPMQSLGPQGGLQRINSDSDRWQRGASFQKGLIPYPQTPLQVMHKAEKKYEIGKVTDEEEAKQRQLKSILNKLTPQNFEKLFEQVKQVNIDNFVTLSGVISQIFDKALMEPTFCEMYANFCFHLAAGLPNLRVDNETITFKTLLLNKCQEEFERGEREEEEANKAEEEGENKRNAEEKRLQARRRMLGNIRLIGELYKKKMLTARIMHDCINKLSGRYQTPDEENIEALCKLMSTIGEMMDHPKAKEHMDPYFYIMTDLSNNMALSSRVRFMLKDVIDLRKNRWQQRRKVEGPKKIDEVHRDAAQERQAQSSRLGRAPSMGSSVRRGPPVDFAPRTPSMLPSPNSHMSGFRAVPPQTRGYGSQDARTEERHSLDSRTMSVPLSQRPLGNEPITLGPQGGLARGMAFTGQSSAPGFPLSEMPNPGDSRRMGPGLNGFNSMPDRYGRRGDFTPRYMPDIFAAPPDYDQSHPPDEKVAHGNREIRSADHGFDRSLSASPPTHGAPPISMQDMSSEIVWPEECLRDKSMAAIKEFYSARDENEVALCIKDLNTPSFYPSMISIWVTDSFEKKDMERDLLTKLLISLVKRQDGMINKDQLIKGFESVLSVLEDAVNDAPRAAEFLSRILAQVILENIVGLSAIGRLIYEGGEEQGRLVEIGLAAEVLGGILEIIISEKGDSVLNEMRSSCNLQLENFRPPGSKKSWRLDKFL